MSKEILNKDITWCCSDIFPLLSTRTSFAMQATDLS
jgi:hypothetical protein